MKKTITLITLLLTFFFVVNGQNTNSRVWVTPLKSSFKNVWYFDTYINFSYSAVLSGHDNLKLNNGPHYHTNEKSFDIGMTFDLFKASDKIWRKGFGMTSKSALKTEFMKQVANLHYKFGIGYKRDRLSYSQDGQQYSGVYSNWLSLDAQVAYLVFTAGFKSDIFLNHNIKNTSTYSYEGMYRDCFNPVTFYPYVGMFIGVLFLEFEARMGVGFPSHLNPDKIAYHNPYYSSVNVLYWETRLSIRIFGLNNQL